MALNRKAAITGVAGYTGAYVARIILNDGWEVVNLTGHPDRQPFDNRIKTFQMCPEDPRDLIEALDGCDVLVNTYWIRFEYNNRTFQDAINKTRLLIESSKSAGIKRIIHISIANPEEGKGLPYYDGKVAIEDMIQSSGLDYSIIRPTVIYGREGILINNIAWFLRHLPVFGIPGSGDYQLQPVFVEDLAKLIVDQIHADANTIMDAVGPETYKFTDLLQLIKNATGSKTLLIKVPNWAALIAVKAIGVCISDIPLTSDEREGLSRNLLISHKAPTCSGRLSEWLKTNSDWLGKRYFSEINKHYRK